MKNTNVICCRYCKKPQETAREKDSLAVKALECCSAESICSLGSTTELLEIPGKLLKSLTTSTQLSWEPEWRTAGWNLQSCCIRAQALSQHCWMLLLWLKTTVLLWAHPTSLPGLTHQTPGLSPSINTAEDLSLCWSFPLCRENGLLFLSWKCCKDFLNFFHYCWSTYYPCWAQSVVRKKQK